MNEGEGYITTEISRRKGRGKRRKESPEKREKLLGWERSWEFTSLGEGSFLPRTQGRLIL